MKSKLFKPGEYARLSRMSLAGLLNTLQNSSYAKEMQELALHYKDVPLLEHALYKNLFTTYRKLMRIAPEDLDRILEARLLRQDIESIKDMLRAISRSLPKETVRHHVSQVCFGEDLYGAIVASETVEEAIDAFDFLDPSDFTLALRYFSRTGSLRMIEGVLDNYLYGKMLSRAGSLPREASALKDFLFTEIDIKNLLALIRLKAAEINPAEILSIILTPAARMDSRELREMARAGLQELVELLKDGPYEELFEDVDPTRLDITALENSVERHLLGRSVQFLRRQPLTADVILGFVFAKEVEVRNLQLLGKAAHLNLGEEFVRQNLVVLHG